MQSINKNVRNVREPDSLKTISNNETSHKCGFKHQVFSHVTVAYNGVNICYKVNNSDRWIRITSITSSLENGGAVNCVRQIRHEDNVFIVIGAKAPVYGGLLWTINIKSGRLIRDCFSTPQPVTSLSCYSNSSLTADSGILILVGMYNCKIFLLHINSNTSPNSKQKMLVPTKNITNITTSTMGITTHPCFEIGSAAFRKDVWHYLLPENRTNGKFPGAFVSCIEFFEIIGVIIVGYSMGGWQIWLVTDSKSVIHFTSVIQENMQPVTNFGLLTPENDPHKMLYLWVTHSQSELTEEVEGRDTTATMYQLQFKKVVTGSKPGVNDRYRNITSLLQSFHFNLSATLFVGKESGVFLKLLDFESLQKVNILQGSSDFNGIVASFETTKYIITVLFDLNAWYFAQMPHAPNQIARLSPYISYLPLERTSIPKYCCLQAVKVLPQSLFRGKQSSSEACNIFPSSLNTNVRYHIGNKTIDAFYFPSNELITSDPENDPVNGLSSSALKGIFTVHNGMIHSKNGKAKLLEFLLPFLPVLKFALNEAMNPMLCGLPVGNGEIKTLRHLVSVTSHCTYMIKEIAKTSKDINSTLCLYKHTYYYAKTVLALTDNNILPLFHDRLQENGATMIPLLFTSIGDIMKQISALDKLWDGCLYPPKTIRALLNIFYTKPLDTMLQSVVVCYSLLYIDNKTFDIQNLNILSQTDTDVVKSLYFLDHHEYNNFIKYLPHKSAVFEYCDINNICEILLKRRQRDVAIRMLMILNQEYSAIYNHKTKSLLCPTLSSDYRIDLLGNGSPDMKSFISILDEQLSHKQFLSVLNTLDNQAKFDCLFFFILQKNKLCDLLSAYGEGQKTQKSSSPFLEFMLLYTIKHFSDIELKASVMQQAQEHYFKQDTPLSAQKCQNDISVLSRFCLQSDLGMLKLGASPKIRIKTPEQCKAPRTPPPTILDVSDDFLEQLRTPHPTPLRDKVMVELEAPRSILRSCKTERRNRKRIRFGDDSEESVSISRPVRLSFGGAEFSEPGQNLSPEKKQRTVELHEGVPIAEISPPKSFTESNVQCSDNGDHDEEILIESHMHQDLSNDSISFEIHPNLDLKSSRATLDMFENQQPSSSTNPISISDIKFQFSPVLEESPVSIMGSDCMTLLFDSPAQNVAVSSIVSAESENDVIFEIPGVEGDVVKETISPSNTTDTDACPIDTPIEEILDSSAETEHEEVGRIDAPDSPPIELDSTDDEGGEECESDDETKKAEDVSEHRSSAKDSVKKAVQVVSSDSSEDERSDNEESLTGNGEYDSDDNPPETDLKACGGATDSAVSHQTDTESESEAKLTDDSASRSENGSESDTSTPSIKKDKLEAVPMASSGSDVEDKSENSSSSESETGSEKSDSDQSETYVKVNADVTDSATGIEGKSYASESEHAPSANSSRSDAESSSSHVIREIKPSEEEDGMDPDEVPAALDEIDEVSDFKTAQSSSSVQSQSQFSLPCTDDSFDTWEMSFHSTGSLEVNTASLQPEELRVGDILEESESDTDDDNEEFKFTSPMAVAPHNSWFMETFQDHDKISFDFNIPKHAAEPTRRITRSQKRKAIGSKDTAPLPPAVPVTELILSELPKFETSPQSDISSMVFGKEHGMFSPEIPTVSNLLMTPRDKRTSGRIFSPFTSPLSGIISQPSPPIYRLKPSGQGTFKLEDASVKKPEPSPIPSEKYGDHDSTFSLASDVVEHLEADLSNIDGDVSAVTQINNEVVESRQIHEESVLESFVTVDEAHSTIAEQESLENVSNLSNNNLLQLSTSDVYSSYDMAGSSRPAEIVEVPSLDTHRSSESTELVHPEDAVSDECVAVEAEQPGISTESSDSVCLLDIPASSHIPESSLKSLCSTKLNSSDEESEKNGDKEPEITEVNSPLEVLSQQSPKPAQKYSSESFELIDAGDAKASSPNNSDSSSSQNQITAILPQSRKRTKRHLTIEKPPIRKLIVPPPDIPPTTRLRSRRVKTDTQEPVQPVKGKLRIRSKTNSSDSSTDEKPATKMMKSELNESERVSPIPEASTSHQTPPKTRLRQKQISSPTVQLEDPVSQSKPKRRGRPAKTPSNVDIPPEPTEVNVRMTRSRRKIISADLPDCVKIPEDTPIRTSGRKKRSEFVTSPTKRANELEVPNPSPPKKLRSEGVQTRTRNKRDQEPAPEKRITRSARKR